MFKFLKDKLKSAVDKFKTVAEESSEEVSEDELTLEDQSILEKEEKTFSAQDLLDDSKEESSEETEQVEEEPVQEDDKTISEDIKEEVKPEQVEGPEQVEPVEDVKELDEPEESVSELESTVEETIEEPKKFEEEPKEPVIEHDNSDILNSEKSLDELEEELLSKDTSHSEKEVSVELADELANSISPKKKSSEAEKIPVEEEIIDAEISNITNESEDNSDEELVDEPIVKEESEEVNEDVNESEDESGEEISENSEQVEEPVQEEKKKGFFGKLFGKKSKQEEETSEQVEETIVDKEETEDKQDELSEEKQPIEVKEDSSDLEKTVDGTDLGTPSVVEEPPKKSKKEKKKAKVPEPVVEEVEESVQEKSEKHSEYSEVLEAESVKNTTIKKKGFFGKLKDKVVKFKLDDEKFEELFWDFELALMENNVALEVIEKIKSDLHEQLTNDNISRRGIDDVIFQTLKDSLEEVLDVEPVDLLEQINSKNAEGKPFVICVVGVNGSGKTTTLAKLIRLFQNNNKSVVVAAADTFRAAAIQQVEEHTNNLGVKLIKHDYNADPSAVAFDAIRHAEAKNIDVVLIDTAGRLQSNSNLMDELRKLIRVNKPDFNLFIGESITGNDCVEQAVAFNDAVGINGMVLSKADIDEKGGAAISVSYVTKKPILYLGVGQTYDDLKPFDKVEILSSLGL